MTMLRAGDTFKAANPRRESHLWVVISDPQEYPADSVLIVNLTTWRKDREPACILRPGDHPFVKRKTCVNYADSKLADPDILDKALAQGALVRHRRMETQMLRRIRQGATASEMILLEHLQLLKDQGLVE